VIGFLVHPSFGITREAITAFYVDTHWGTQRILSSMVFVNFWWSMINLLPVFPLDGGQIYASVEKSPRKVFQVGMVVGIVVAVLAVVVFQRLFGAALFGYLAYQNYQRLQQLGGGGGFR